ncbi:heavy-metal-associated domain-containing protein [Lysobacter humi (ex Lee et al. 2017)]
MRTLLLAAFLLLSQAAHAAGARSVTFKVENFTCAACAITITTALDRVAGVSARTVDAKSATVRITFDPARVNEARIATALRDAGFPARRHAR